MRFLIAAFALFISAPAFGEEAETLMWEDLLPEGEMERLNKIFAEQAASMWTHDESMMGMAGAQIKAFNVVDELDGARIRIPGFVLPFEYSASGEITEFLLVPYFGACIHTPPPPPNQIVYVTSEDPANLGQQWNAIWATGVMRTKTHINDLGDTAYTLELESWEDYDG